MNVIWSVIFFFQNHNFFFTDLFGDDLCKMMENDDGVGGIGDINDSALDDAEGLPPGTPTTSMPTTVMYVKQVQQLTQVRLPS